MTKSAATHTFLLPRHLQLRHLPKREHEDQYIEKRVHRRREKVDVGHVPAALCVIVSLVILRGRKVGKLSQRTRGKLVRSQAAWIGIH